MSAARKVGLLIEASHPEPALAVTVFSAALAASAGRSAPGVIAVAAAVLAGQLSIGWCNDYVDRQRDAATGRRDKPVARGAIGAGVVRTAAAVSVVLVVPLSLLSGWRAAVAHCLAVGLAWAYDLRLKATAWSVLPYAVAFGLLPTFIALGLAGAPLPAWWAPVAGALLGSGAHFANTMPDLAADIATGVRGLPHRIGPAATRITAITLLGAASVVLAFAPGVPGSTAGTVLVVLALVAVAAIMAAGVLRGRRLGSRAPFRATMLVALVDVVLLVARGRALA
jgi:4-hydroxybenzoate polyprenyltransferase